MLTNVVSDGNNAEHFNTAPVSGGFKVTRSRGVTVTNSSFDYNLGYGFWADESTYNVTVANSTMVGNAKHGISVEISAKATIANNLIANNAATGIKINDVNGARIYNNTILDNVGRPLNIVQDDRRASDLSISGHDKRQSLPDPTVTWINSDGIVANNILSGTKDSCLLCVEDYSKSFSGAQMVNWTNGNVYQRDSASSPSKVVYWSAKSSTSTFATLAAFQKANGAEWTALELNGTEAADGKGAATDVVNANSSWVANTLPSDIAALVGQDANVRHLGIFS